MPTLVKTTRKPRGKKLKTANFWAIRYQCPHRKRSWCISTQCKNRDNAKKKLREFTNLLEQGLVGLISPFREIRQSQDEAQQRLSIEECLKIYEGDLSAGRVRSRGRRTPVNTEYLKLSMSRLRKVFTGCRITAANQINVETINRFFDGAMKDGTINSAQTRKHYERSCKAFSKWLMVTERLPADPLARLACTYVDPDSDIVHNRTEFTMAEIATLIESASKGPVLAGMTGHQRALLYAFAASTGFRAKECRSIRRSFFADDWSSVSLAGRFNKNKKAACQPIPPGLRESLAEFCSGLEPEALLWPMVEGDSIDILRADAEGTGIIIGRKNSVDGKVRDFHSYRHSFVSNLERAGVSESMKQRLSRATGGIVSRYTHRDDEQVQREAERL